MPAGIQIINTHNTIQIDENFLNYRLISKSQQTSGPKNISDSEGFAFVGCKLAVSGLDVLVAVRSAASVALVSTVSRGAELWDLCIAVPSGAVVEFYLYRPGIPRDSGYGLQVFDASGNLVFDALSPTLRVVEAVSTLDYRTMQTSWSLQSGRQYGVIFSQWAGTRTVSYRPFSPGYQDRITVEQGPSISFQGSTMIVNRISALMSDTTLVSGGSRPGGGGVVSSFGFLVADLTDQ